MRSEIEAKTSRFGLTSKVIFTGIRADTSALFTAMDVFVMPSLYEGFPVVLVEAQASGLTCIVSDRVITKEVKILETTKFISFNEPIEVWAEAILRTEKNKCNRAVAVETVKRAGYSIVDTSEQLSKAYLGE